MTRDKAEKLATLFLAIFSTAMAAQLAMTGALQSTGWAGALAATLGSIALAICVRVWPQPQAQTVTARRD